METVYGMIGVRGVAVRQHVVSVELNKEIEPVPRLYMDVPVCE